MPYDIFYPNVPYVLLVAGFLASVTSGFAFSETLKQSINTWSNNRAAMSLNDIRDYTLLVPFFGTCVGVCIFLASGIQIFAFSPRFAYTLSLPLTIVGGIMLWYQLGQVLAQIQKGGSRALDLDAY